MIRITHLITDLRMGGAEMALYRLLAGMDREAFSCQVVSLTAASPVGEMIGELGIPVSALGMSPGARSLAAVVELWRCLRRQRPQVLQTWLYHADLLGLLMARPAGVQTVVWNLRCSDVDWAQYRPTTRWAAGVCALLSRLPAAVAVNSETGRHRHIAMGYRPKRWELIPNGFDLQRYRPDLAARESLRRELGLPLDVLLVGLVARFDAMKDQRNFLEAAALLHRWRPDIRFVLCGREVDEANSRLRGWVEELGLGQVSHLLGERRDVERVAAALDIASSSSRGEGFPNAVGEAMACGVPCAVTDVGDSASLVGDTGVVVPPRDPAALASAWRTLLAMSEADRRALGMAARDRIASRFAAQKAVQRYEKLYRELAHG